MWEALNEPMPLEKINLAAMKTIADLGGREILNPSIFFTKIEDKTIEIRLKSLQDKMHLTTPATKDTQVLDNLVITIDDFKKVDLRVGKIIEAKKVEKSDKLIQMQVQVGSELRQIVGGLALFYKPEELLNKKVVVVYNLKPSKLMGLNSQGMLLAAKINNSLVLLTVEKDIDDGAKIS
jgi:methionine--tRNA ligase beta chain